MRVFLVVIDSFGIGSAPDAELYHDVGANTAGHIIDVMQSPRWPNLMKMGLGQAMLLADPERKLSTMSEVEATAYGCLVPSSAGKDTVSGHWELCGIKLDSPFLVFPEKNSFPDSLLLPFKEEFKCDILGNEAASGTEIISRLGKQHVESGRPILYTSADSVVQIAAHESIISPEKLYEMCHYMRDLVDDLNVGRVIARPFNGDEGSYERTSRRKDFAMEPPRPNLLSRLQDSGIETIGVGKIGDIFSGQGLSQSYPDKGNVACLQRLEVLWNDDSSKDEFIFVNLVDTDSIYGHRRDPQGYGKAVELIDEAIGRMQESSSCDKQLIITADHGCDPTWRGSDHTRECVPYLQWQAGSSVESIGRKSGFRHCAERILATFSSETDE